MRPHEETGQSRTSRWLRGLRPDHNPLRRASDRAESAVLALLLGAFLVGAPLLAIACGQLAATAAIRTANAQHAARHQVTAVLTTDTPGPVQTAYGGLMPVEVSARWTTPDGITHTGKVFAPSGDKAGSLVSIWIDTAGRPATAPLRASDASSQRALAALLAPAALAMVLLGAWALARRILDKRRMAAWDADWQATGPRWTTLR
jgi:hypothetical protein